MLQPDTQYFSSLALSLNQERREPKLPNPNPILRPFVNARSDTHQPPSLASRCSFSELAALLPRCTASPRRTACRRTLLTKPPKAAAKCEGHCSARAPLLLGAAHLLYGAGALCYCNL
ncbi:uncharacterized protein DS421_5g167660 [Arachis hypogaea]|nr:uncharacterized protein DS421_5g167660 [Arachis hypogaea]